jgi:hypothetical protein
MRNSLTSSVRRLAAGWYWPLVLLALPNCDFQGHGVGSGLNLYPGPPPHTTLVLCDIEQVLQRHCATDADKAMGIRLADAAIALNEGRTNAVGLDDSPAALARCGGEPEAVPYIGPFPEGQATCLNGTFLGAGATYPTPTDVCVLLCEDGFGSTNAASGTLLPDVPPDPAVASFCTAHAIASTNLPGDPNPGFAGACTPDGGERPDFDSPLFPDSRRNPEPVVWGDLTGVSAGGSTLTRTAAATGNFDAGAAATQSIARGDAYVEFGAAESNLTHVAGLSAIVGGCPSGCPADTDPSLADIDFAISLNVDGRYYVLEHGALIAGPDVNGSFGTYSTADRFRVTLHDHSDGTADVAYSKLVGACMPRTPCAETVFRTVTGSPAHYPLRADASFREPGATLSVVTLVRIH